MKNSIKTFVLVHAAWHGAWSFDRTRKKLEASGAKVIIFDLPGHGGDFGNSRQRIPFQTMHPGIYPILRRAS
ncbi:alpha/beta fold hydrolase [Pedobacter miscanthi]|uniref:AB hydrolase-1 domain-containing protein n=1 Tax=Pedobacter miscanthi TaxID=2259170 RepID=A0A366KQY6_9SPHI|nr:alpha/beta fold hydrolase [Pedobacter miscanthi]RBQ04045.1 hypothetical protein DRW42_19710 [Pedobacter miscanthi]